MVSYNGCNSVWMRESIENMVIFVLYCMRRSVLDGM